LALTLVELAVTVMLVGLVVGAAAVGTAALAGRADRQLADLTLDRVVQAQVSQARTHGGYVFGDADADLQARLPAGLTRDLDVVHGVSTGPGQVSVAVGAAGTLVVAVALPDDTCRWRQVSSPTTGGVTAQASATSRCLASSFLPAGEAPAWQ